MEAFQCPYLGGTVELSDNRARHIKDDHSGFPIDLFNYIAGTLASPDLVLRKRPVDNTILFYRWYHGLNKYMVVIVVDDDAPRYWIVTAYVSHRLQRGETLWQRI